MNINIISQGVSILARDVVLGGRQLTEQIQNRFDISFEEAEAIKIGRTDPGDNREELEGLFVSACSQWVTEVKRAIDFYYSNYPDDKLSRIILSGGGAKIKGLAEFFTKEINIPVDQFNPFKKVSVPGEQIDPEYIKSIAPEMVLCAGLATRPVEV
jgi:type IV pilus assembly protein PilM